MSSAGPPRSALAGEVLQGTYRIERCIGRGATGAVYEASHLRLVRRFAVKVLFPEVAEHPEALARFQKEALVTSGLGHPHILEVVDFNHMEDGTPYIIMELLEGQNREDRIRERGPMEVPRHGVEELDRGQLRDPQPPDADAQVAQATRQRGRVIASLDSLRRVIRGRMVRMRGGAARLAATSRLRDRSSASRTSRNRQPKPWPAMAWMTWAVSSRVSLPMVIFSTTRLSRGRDRVLVTNTPSWEISLQVARNPGTRPSRGSTRMSAAMPRFGSALRTPMPRRVRLFAMV